MYSIPRTDVIGYSYDSFYGYSNHPVGYSLTTNPLRTKVTPLPTTPTTSISWTRSIVPGLSEGQQAWVHAIAQHPELAVNQISLPAVDVNSLSTDEWLQLLSALQQSKISAHENISKLIDILIFDVSDQLFRIFWHLSQEDKSLFLAHWKSSLSSYPSLYNSRLHLQIQFLESSAERPQIQLAEVAIKTFDGHGSIFPTQKLDGNISSLEPRKLRVLQASIETPFHVFGGAGSVVSCSHTAHQQAGAVDFWGYFPLYERDKCRPDLIDLCPYALVRHLYNGKEVHSTIYQDVKKHTFFVNPDQKESGRLFDIGSTPGRVYQTFANISSIIRSFYLGSSLAVFSATSLGSQRVHVIQAENTLVGSATFELLRSLRDPFEQVGYPIPKKISVIHGLGNLGVNIQNYHGIGAYPTMFFGEKHQVLPSVVLTCDKAVPVSVTYSTDLMSRDPFLSENLSLLPDDQINGKMHPINNGLNPASYDIANPTTMGKWACQDLDQIIEYKASIKHFLVEHGIIACADKPLFVFVGRFSTEKGVMQLPGLVKEILANGGQVVVMGTDSGCMGPIIKLEQMVDDATSPLALRVYKNLHDQTKLLDNVKVGNLIRACADMFLVPSFQESFGLVPLEANMAGAPVICPYASGFKETMKPANMLACDGASGSIQKDATAYCYANPRSGTLASAVISVVFKDYLALSDGDRSKIAKRLRQHTIDTHSWYDPITGTGIINRYTTLYHELCGNKVDCASDIEDPTDVETTLAPTTQSPQVPSLPILTEVKASAQSLGLMRPAIVPKASGRSLARSISPVPHISTPAIPAIPKKALMRTEPITISNYLHTLVQQIFFFIQSLWFNMKMIYKDHVVKHWKAHFAAV